MKKKLTKLVFLILIVVFMSICLILPLFFLFIKAFQNKNNNFVGLSNFIEYFNNPNTSSSLINSLKVSITVTILVTVIAFLFSYGINRTNLKYKKVFKFIALLPLFAPTMTHGIGLIYIFGRQGIFTKITGIELPIYGFLGIVLSNVLFIFPVLFFLFFSALNNEDYRKYEVAQLIGESKLKQFFDITLPNIKYSIINGIFTAFTLSFVDFGAPKVIGGNYNVLATDIFKQVIGQQNFSMGSTIGILLLIPACIAFLLDFFISFKNSKIETSSLKYKINNNLIRDYIFYIFNFLISLIIVFLFGIVIFASFIKNWPYELSLSFRAYTFYIMGESIWEILKNSILVSLFTAIFGTLITFFTAYLIEREKKYKLIRKICYFLSLIPNAVPGLTIGLAYIFFFNLKNNPLNFLYGTFGIIIFANIVHFFSTPFLTITTRLKELDLEYEAISEIMGIDWYITIFRVIVPLSFDVIIESFSYYFVNSMITISAVIFLYTSKTRLLSIVMIGKNDAGEISSAAAIAVIIFGINIGFKIILDVFLKFLKNLNYSKEKKEKERKSQQLKMIGKEVLKILNEVSCNTGVKYWLEFGTLLGKIRENNFIAHDVNFDIGVMKEELNPKFLIDLEERGFKRISTLSIKNEGLQGINYNYKGIEVEIFLFKREGKKVISYSEGKDKKIYFYKLSDSHLEEVKFMGIDTFIPRNSIRRLLEIYGNNFNISNVNWKDEMSLSRYLSTKEKETSLSNSVDEEK